MACESIFLFTLEIINILLQQHSEQIHCTCQSLQVGPPKDCKEVRTYYSIYQVKYTSLTPERRYNIWLVFHRYNGCVSISCNRASNIAIWVLFSFFMCHYFTQISPSPFSLIPTNTPNAPFFCTQHSQALAIDYF